MDPFIPLTDPGPAVQKREGEKRAELHPAHSMSGLTAGGTRGKAGPGPSASKSMGLCTAQERFTIVPKSFSLSQKYLKGYHWLKLF